MCVLALRLLEHEIFKLIAEGVLEIDIVDLLTQI